MMLLSPSSPFLRYLELQATMAATTARENGVLKLVHPGRLVETHREPITAAEVMRKNPRHSVTRPDVFEFPWVVVKPESVLVPGKVFLIVPNKTIYKLIKKHKNQSSRQLIESAKKEIIVSTQQSEKQSSKQKSYMHQTQSQGLKKPPVLVSCWYGASATASPSPRERVSDEKVKRQSQVGFWPETNTNKNHRTNVNSDNEKSRALVIYGAVESKCRKQVAELKSCLRKHDSARKFLRHKVTFVLSNEEEEEEMQERVTDSSIEFPGFLPCSRP